MKKIRIGSVEFFGCIGMFLWAVAVVLRGMSLSNYGLYQFFLNILPNFAAAWTVTMVGKWLVENKSKRKIHKNEYLVVCFTIFMLALASEFLHDYFFNSAFDPCDILSTILAQTIIYYIPLKKEIIQ